MVTPMCPRIEERINGKNICSVLTQRKARSYSHSLGLQPHNLVILTPKVYQYSIAPHWLVSTYQLKWTCSHYNISWHRRKILYKPDLVTHTLILAVGWLKEEDVRVKASLGYTKSSRSTWATYRYSTSRNKQKSKLRILKLPWSTQSPIDCKEHSTWTKHWEAALKMISGR